MPSSTQTGAHPKAPSNTPTKAQPKAPTKAPSKAPSKAPLMALSKPCNIVTAPRDINLDKNEENILPEQTHTIKAKSTKQTKLDMNAMENKIVAMQKKYKQLKTLQKQSEKNSRASKSAHHLANASNEENGYESEEADPPSRKGFFAQQATLLGIITASSKPKKPLQRHNGPATTLKTIDNIFNTPATMTITCRRSPSTRDTNIQARRDPQSQTSPAISPSHGSPSTSPQGSFPTSDWTKHPSNCARSSLQLSSAGPPTKILKCVWRDGKAPTGRPGARDYVSEITTLILESTRQYAALVVSNNLVPLPNLQIAWATRCWQDTCERNGKQYKLLDHIIGLDAAQSRVQQAFAFNKTNDANSKIGRKNQKYCCILLKDDTFIYKDIDDHTGLYETKLISECIQDAFFKNKRSIGVEFQDYFDPISLATIALVLTTIEFCISKWKTGVYVQSAFDEKMITNRFKCHLKGLHKWCDAAPEVVFKIWTKLFWHALWNAGASVVEETGNISNDALHCAQEELANRTGDTDSEDDAMDEGGEDVEGKNGDKVVNGKDRNEVGKEEGGDGGKVFEGGDGGEVFEGGDDDEMAEGDLEDDEETKGS